MVTKPLPIQKEEQTKRGKITTHKAPFRVVILNPVFKTLNPKQQQKYTIHNNNNNNLIAAEGKKKLLLDIFSFFCFGKKVFLYQEAGAMYEGIEKEEEATTTTTTMRKSVHRPSNALDMTQPLLYHRLRESGVDATKVFFPDTVDFGVDSTDNETECYSYGSSSPIMGPAPTIDNTTLVYIPVRLPCGIQVQCAPEVLSGCPMVLRSLQTDLTQIFQVLPWSVHNLVKRTTIWVNASYCYGSRDDPRVLRHSTAHHEEGWLIHW